MHNVRIALDLHFVRQLHAADIGIFYMQLASIRQDMRALGSGKFDGDLASKAKIIKEDLPLWEETDALGQKLVTALKKVAE